MTQDMGQQEARNHICWVALDEGLTASFEGNYVTHYANITKTVAVEITC